MKEAQEMLSPTRGPLKQTDTHLSGFQKRTLSSVGSQMRLKTFKNFQAIGACAQIKICVKLSPLGPLPIGTWISGPYSLRNTCLPNVNLFLLSFLLLAYGRYVYPCPAIFGPFCILSEACIPENRPSLLKENHDTVEYAQLGF